MFHETAGSFRRRDHATIGWRQRASRRIGNPTDERYQTAGEGALGGGSPLPRNDTRFVYILGPMCGGDLDQHVVRRAVHALANHAATVRPLGLLALGLQGSSGPSGAAVDVAVVFGHRRYETVKAERFDQVVGNAPEPRLID